MSRAPAGTTQPPFWVACVVAGLLLVTAGLLVARGARAAPDRRTTIAPVDVGSVPPTHLARARSDPARAAARPAPRRQGRAARPDTVVGGTLRLLGRTASITPVGTVANVMQVPLDPLVIGWWRDGVEPGTDHGTAVLVGHVNYAGVTGTLALLPSLRPGNLVTIAERHRTLRFRITGVRTYDKTSGLPQGVFSTAGAPRLALITCGGPFDRATGNYEDNIVAYAVPA